MKKSLMIGIIIIVVIIVLVIVFLPYILIIIVGSLENPSRDRALTIEAVNKGDYKICDKVANGYMMSNAAPRRDCYEAVIKKTVDTGICQKKLSIGKDDCYTILSSVIKNPELCSQINNSLTRLYCYVDVAEKSGDYRICDNINEDNEWGILKGQCYGYFVKKGGNFSICSLINVLNISDICYTYYLESGDINLKFCDNFKTIYGKSSCFYSVAINERDIDICEMIQGEDSQYKRENCINRILFLINSSSNSIKEGTYINEISKTLRCTFESTPENVDMVSVTTYYDEQNNPIGYCKYNRGPKSNNKCANNEICDSEDLYEIINDGECKGYEKNKYFCNYS